MTTMELLGCIIGMALVTALARILPLTLLTERQLPLALIRCLNFVPVAVLSALLAPELLIKDEHLFLSMDNLYLLAAIPTWLVCWKTNSFFGAILTGIAAVAFGRMLGW